MDDDDEGTTGDALFAVARAVRRLAEAIEEGNAMKPCPVCGDRLKRLEAGVLWCTACGEMVE